MANSEHYPRDRSGSGVAPSAARGLRDETRCMLSEKSPATVAAVRTALERETTLTYSPNRKENTR